jgi:hypothetical protein
VILLPNKYSYVTTIEVGLRTEGKAVVPIESVETTLSKLQESYLPAAQRSYLQDHAGDAGVYKVIARIPKNSSLLVLESTASEANSAPCRQIQEMAVQALLADHGRVFSLMRLGVEQQKQRAEEAMKSLIDQAHALQQQFDRIEQADKLIQQQIAETRAQLDLATTNRARAIGETGDEARAITLLTLDSEISANRRSLTDLQQQLQIGQAEKRDELQNRLRENTQQQALQRTEIQQIDLQLSNLQATRSLGVAIRSPRPVGRSPSLIVALSVVMGGMLALLVPLVLEFIDRVRHGLAAAPAGNMIAVASVSAD